MGDDRAVHHAAQTRRQRPDLFGGHDSLVRERAAPAAVLLGNAQAQQTQFACRIPHFTIDVVLLTPALLVGCAVPLEEATGQVGQCVEVFVHPV